MQQIQLKQTPCTKIFGQNIFQALVVTSLILQLGLAITTRIDKMQPLTGSLNNFTQDYFMNLQKDSRFLLSNQSENFLEQMLNEAKQNMTLMYQYVMLQPFLQETLIQSQIQAKSSTSITQMNQTLLQESIDIIKQINSLFEEVFQTLVFKFSDPDNKESVYTMLREADISVEAVSDQLNSSTNQTLIAYDDSITNLTTPSTNNDTNSNSSTSNPTNGTQNITNQTHRF
eukprot:403338662